MLSITTITSMSTFAISVNSGDIAIQTISKKMTSIFNNSQSLQLNAIKTVHDFAGNEFYVAECSPTGYFIYNLNTDTVVESSEKGISPYTGLNENLFYGGPTYYYIFKNGIYKHTLFSSEVLSASQIASLKQSCQTGYRNIETSYQRRGWSISTQAIDTTDKTVKHPDFYQNLTHCGYTDGGHCGFIALGMLIAYKDKYEDNELMDDKYWENSSTKTTLESKNTNGITVSANTVISQKLYELDPKDETTSMHIHTVAEKYLKEVGKSANHTTRWKPLFTESTVRSLIDEDNPVILFGLMPEDPNTAKSLSAARVASGDGKTEHAVVAYGYTSDKEKFIVHYGWESHSYFDVKVDLGYFSLGSIYIFDLK